MKTKPNAADTTSQRQPIASKALRTGGLTGIAILSGLLIACDGSGVTSVHSAWLLRPGLRAKQ